MIAVIFDVDGVLIDSGEAHYEAFRLFGERRGLPFSRDFFLKFFGIHNNQIFPLWFGHKIARDDLDAYALEKENLYREIAPKFVKPIDGAIALVRRLHKAGFRLAVGSSGPRANAKLALRILAQAEQLSNGTEVAVPFESCFSALATGDDVTEGKPAPDIFLLASRLLNVPPNQCVVIEDAPQGVAAARAAEMACIALTSSRPADELKNAKAIISTLDELSPNRVESLITL